MPMMGVQTTGRVRRIEVVIRRVAATSSIAPLCMVVVVITYLLCDETEQLEQEVG